MDNIIKSFQDYLKTSPTGISYSGASDGYMNAALKSSLSSLESNIKDKLSKSSNKENQEKAKSFTIISGDKIIIAVDAVKKIIDDINKEKSPNIKAAQEIFNSNPFGLTYAGPKDGEMNADFLSSLISLENKITETTGALASGKIVSRNNLLTDAADLSKTFSLIKSYQDFIKKKS